MKKVKPKKVAAPSKPKLDYKEHWKGMPEFTQENLKPVKTLIVNFETKEDLHKFSKLMGQQITAKTAYIWYPERREESLLNRRWSKK